MKLSRYIVYFVLLLFFCQQVFGVGLGGNSLIYDFFKPNSEYSFSYIVYADTKVKNNYVAYASKDLAPYVEFEQDHFEDIPAREQFPLRGKIKFPSELEPGWHTAYVCIREDCKNSGMMCARANVCASLNFMSLHPGVYPKVSLNTQNVNQDEPVEFKASVQNYGKDDIKKASGIVEVFNLNREKVGSASIESGSIPSTESKVLKGIFDTQGLLPGNYSGTATIDCDGTEKKANTTFRIGTLNVKIKDWTEKLEQGGIRKFDTVIESAWNDPLEVYGIIKIYGNGTSLESKTAAIELLPWKTTTLEAFIDTSKLNIDEYNLQITLFYNKKTSVSEGKLDIIESESPPLKEVPKQEDDGKSSSATLTIALVAIVIMLTLINIFLALYRKKKQ